LFSFFATRCSCDDAMQAQSKHWVWPPHGPVPEDGCVGRVRPLWCPDDRERARRLGQNLHAVPRVCPNTSVS
jgi:hypothetical protein